MLELNAGAALRVKSKSYMIGKIEVVGGCRLIEVVGLVRIDEYTLSTSPLS
jgi:hypothetical protein